MAPFNNLFAGDHNFCLYETGNKVGPLQPITMSKHLIYEDDTKPGITRRQPGRGFAYFDARGRRLKSQAEEQRSGGWPFRRRGPMSGSARGKRRTCKPPGAMRGAVSNIRAAVDSVASQIGNTPTICRECYVHPVISLTKNCLHGRQLLPTGI